MGDLNLFQQICVQMFAVDLAGMFIGDEEFLQNAMNMAANYAIDTQLGKYGWKITWGPRVWKTPEALWFEGLDNCWMISMAPRVDYPDGKFDTYVVAIAGTAVFSATTWINQDFGVGHVIDFDEFTKTFKTGNIPVPKAGPRPPSNVSSCALGTALGLYNLTTKTSPKGNPGENTTILEYLAGLNSDSGKFRVIFTGHSLGGALSPALALAVKANTLIPALAQSPENIRAFPAAGASPGNHLFRDAYHKLFPASGSGGYQLWNADLYNSLDIVPHAWSIDIFNDRRLQKIFGIYGHLPKKVADLVGVLVILAITRASAAGIIYEPIQGNQFTGAPPGQPPDTLISLFLEVAKQHTTAYHNEVNVGSHIAELYKIIAGAEGVRKKTIREAALSLPVFSDTIGLTEDDPRSLPESGSDFVANPNDLDADIHPYDCVLNA